MRNVVLLALALFAAGCATGQPPVEYGPPESATSPLRGIIHSKGEGDAQVVYIPLGTDQKFPVTALYRWSHDVTVVVQPYAPYLIIDGGGDLIVEPIPGNESKAQEALDRGLVQIQRGGAVSNTLNAPGSIEAMSAVAPMPPPAPPPAPTGLGSPPTHDG